MHVHVMDAGLDLIQINDKKLSPLNFFHILYINSGHVCAPLSEIKNWGPRLSLRKKSILKMDFHGEN